MIDLSIRKYLSMTFNLDAETIGEYTLTSGKKNLEATIDREPVKAIFGLDIDADSFDLTVKTNGKYLTNVVLQYTTSNGASVEINTSYTYEPVAK